ncbi:energy-coupling factor transporter transmembrane component T [Nocardioides zeae]|uniref:Energy-coupling factor transporter transmembrane protein EcfT n=1 Tax=Nocardioides zeae TaxID=1457234 RepID=A0A6P0HF22_9ACTN|nr:energy-coupling factor transporter transmembrane component T [Nocardioides zeae]NEN77253.1 energy-coupling factor transporter transmembrane protein EcfT [Nocardioides zeae]
MVGSQLAGNLLPRDLHPLAWWVWALGLAVAASRTTNPWLLLLVTAVVVHVVVSRRSDAPWALAFRMYVYLGLTIIAIRVFFRFVFGGAEGTTIILRLPEIPLPVWAAGIRLFGDVSAESVLGGLYDGMRLATMVICVGAANALANPKRLLKSMPSALYEIGTTVTVALAVFPQLAESTQRVRRARALRGTGGSRFEVLRSIVVPVLEDALDRSLTLAASMDSRGYGRTGSPSRASRRITGTLMATGLVGVCVGVYSTLDGTTPALLATPMLLAGLGLAVAGFVVAGRRVERSQYRPDRWRAAELATALSGIAVAVAMFRTSSVDPTNLNPSLTTLSWPLLAWPPVLAILVGLLPAIATPPPAPPHVGLDDMPDDAPIPARSS